MEEIKRLTKNTAVPIGFIVIILGAFMGWAYSYGEVNQRLENIEHRVASLEEYDTPSRNEYNQLREDIREIKDSISLLTSELLKKNN